MSIEETRTDVTSSTCLRQWAGTTQELEFYADLNDAVGEGNGRSKIVWCAGKGCSAFVEVSCDQKSGQFTEITNSSGLNDKLLGGCKTPRVD